MTKPKVLDIGQCDADHGSIRRLLEGLGAEVLRAHTASQALLLLKQEAPRLVLVNRIIDADGDDGVSLVKALVSSKSGRTEVMLVSNYAEYQTKAVALGALEGFGKAALRDPLTIERISNTLKS